MKSFGLTFRDDWENNSKFRKVIKSRCARHQRRLVSVVMSGVSTTIKLLIHHRHVRGKVKEFFSLILSRAGCILRFGELDRAIIIYIIVNLLSL